MEEFISFVEFAKSTNYEKIDNLSLEEGSVIIRGCGAFSNAEKAHQFLHPLMHIKSRRGNIHRGVQKSMSLSQDGPEAEQTHQFLHPLMVYCSSIKGNRALSEPFDYFHQDHVSNQ